MSAAKPAGAFNADPLAALTAGSFTH